jgi:PAS domain S-box-containing protein
MNQPTPPTPADASARDLAVPAMPEGEAHFRVLFESAGIGITLVDMQGRPAQSNPALQKILGYTAEELRSMVFTDFTHPEDRQRDWGLYQELMAGTRDRYELEKRYIRKDGKIVSGFLTVSLLKDAQGQPLYAIGMLQDITARSHAEAQLLNETALSDAVINSLPGVFYMFDRQGRLQRWNDEFARVVGITRETAHTHLLGDLIVAEDKAKVQAAVEEAYAAGQTTVEARIIVGEGVRWYHFVARHLQIGEHAYLVGCGHDITNRKTIEDQHVRLSTAVDQSAETILITDTDGNIVYVNPAFEATTGYSAAEAIGRNPRFLKSGKQDGAFYKQMWQTLKRGEVWQGHFINRRKDGALYEEEATISPIRDSSGKIVSYTAIKLDVTRQLELEAQFRQSQKLDAIGQLAGGVAHDFNNILAAMMMEVELVSADRNLPPQIHDLLQNLRRSAERAADLTRQLVLFSRKQVMQRRNLDLNESVTSLARMLRRIIGEQVQLQLNLHPAPLPVYADSGMIDQVLLNLVVNARDAMPGGGRILIETSHEILSPKEAASIVGGPAGTYACLTVVDNGCGMPPEIHSRIFEPFFTTKEPGKGTGLGLATVFGILKQHEGAITVQSEVGQGSTFRVYLRAAEADLVPEPVPARAKPAGGSETILLVEDESTVRQLAAVVLERAGYRVFEAANGVEALRIWEKQRGAIQLLLTDIVMPQGISGRELAARLQAANPALRVVFTSGYSAEIAGSDLSLKVGQKFIQKPWFSEQLLDTVRSCLDG